MIVFALLIGHVPPWVISITCFSALLFNIFLLPRISGRSLERTSEHLIGFSPGLIIYPAILFFISLLFQHQQIFLVIGWGALAFGDGFANLLGRKFGKTLLPWNKQKSWEGFLAFVCFAFMLTALLLVLLPDDLRMDYDWNHWQTVIGIAVVFSAIWESVPGTIDDNFVVPLSASLSAYYMHLFLMNGSIKFPDESLVYLSVAFALGLASLITRKITMVGAIIGIMLTCLLMLAFGWIGLLAIGVFFAFGTLASSWEKKAKTALKLAEANEGKRSYENVLANAGVPAILALVAWTLPGHDQLYTIMMLACFAAALSDTISSEVGNVKGKRFFNIVSLKKGVRGEDGVISWEGSISGLMGSALIALLYPIFYSEQALLVWLLITLSGFSGNLTDSVLGALLQKRGFMNNHTVNFFNTLFASLCMWGFFYLLVK